MHMFVQREGRKAETVIYSARKCFEEPREVLLLIRTTLPACSEHFCSLISVELYFHGALRLCTSRQGGYMRLDACTHRPVL